MNRPIRHRIPRRDANRSKASRSLWALELALLYVRREHPGDPLVARLEEILEDAGKAFGLEVDR